MKKFKTTVYCALVLSCMLPLQAEVLNWRASTGQQYETKKTVTEYVTMLDTVTTKPTLILKEAVLQETAAQNKSTLDHIKGIPSFPHGSVDVGSKWTASAMLSWNLSGFGFNEPLVIEIPVSYTCTNMEKIEGRTYYRILATWHPFYITDESTARKSSITRISGLSTMSILWDAKSGSPKHIELSEETQYRFNDKSSLVYTRKINDEFRTVMDITRERTISELQEQIVKQKVQNVEVKQTDEGIVLSIENIQFEPDSHVLIDTERKKIGNIGIILATLSDRKIQILGHAANTPGSNEEELMELSAARAGSVAEYLIKSGFRLEDSIISIGMGGTVPLASNDNPEGRSKNRRVEILIMDAEEIE